jgi:D-alanyl-D-alanine endopeptidase (penicillin-binding protein 7)
MKRWVSTGAPAALAGVLMAVWAAAGLSFMPSVAVAQTQKPRAVVVKSPSKPGTQKALKAKTRKTSPSARSVVRVSAPAKPSYGQTYGLRQTDDPLDLKSSVAFVIDQDTKEVLVNKNANAVLPIASLTKLMTALVVAEAGLRMDDVLTITEADIDTEKGTGSRLPIGTRLTRHEMMHLALMSSENRAANALGRHYPGGLPVFVAAMNRKARELGMHDTRYVEPTGLSSRNQSSAKDLANLVQAAYQQPLLRELSTSPDYQVVVEATNTECVRRSGKRCIESRQVPGTRTLQYTNTNRLVRHPGWDIGLQKTGYISEAGQCLVMQAQMAGRKLIMVFLDSAGKLTRLADAERVRHWVDANAASRSVGDGPWMQRSMTPRL